METLSISRDKISIHAPPRGATGTHQKAACPSPFQFTPLREGRPKKSQKNAKKGLFQFTPLREGRPTRAGRMRISKMYFNSRPSARGDVKDAVLFHIAVISIHAPPRGATLTSLSGSTCPMLISIHAPPRGATVLRFVVSAGSEEFQFTPLREGRPGSSFPGKSASLFQFTPLREGRQL